MFSTFLSQDAIECELIDLGSCASSRAVQGWLRDDDDDE